VAGRLGAGNGCDWTRAVVAGRVAIEPVTSWRGAGWRLLEAKGLESKRAEFSQPARAVPTKARTATRGKMRKADCGRQGAVERGMWLLTHTQIT
jgi:hypothetical protein